VNSDTFLEKARAQAQDQINRARVIMDSIDDDTINRVPKGNLWTVGQVFDHMIIANTPYLAVMEEKVSTSKANGPGEIKHSWLGNFLMKAGGPDGNAPAPKFMIPAPPPTSRERIDLWFAQMDLFLQIIDRAKGLDLSRVKAKNPYFKLLPMNLADFVGVTVQHTERHIRQIEERSKDERSTTHHGEQA